MIAATLVKRAYKRFLERRITDPRRADSTFQEMFGGFGVAVSRPALTQAQIKAIRDVLSQLAEERR